MSWYTLVGGSFTTNSNDQSVSGIGEVGHCDRSGTVCLDKGIGVQIGVGTLNTPIMERAAGVTSLRDYDFVSLNYHVRAGVLYNPAAWIGLGPVLRAGMSHRFTTETILPTNGAKIQENHFHHAAPFLTIGAQFLMTGTTFGGYLEAGAATFPALPGQDRTLGFHGQGGLRIQL